MEKIDDGVLSKDTNTENKTSRQTTKTSKELLYSEKFSNDPLEILKTNSNSVKTSPKTFKLPPSSILSQVKYFLPKIVEANLQLQQELREEPEKLNIENVGEGQNYIEMNLAMVDNLDSDSSDSDSDMSDDDDTSSGNIDNEIKDSIQHIKAKIEILEEK